MRPVFAPRLIRAKFARTDSAHEFARHPNLVLGLAITRPDQVWVADITYVALRECFVFLAVIMDVFTRGVRGWALSRRIDTALALSALEMALSKGTPVIHHSDQGAQYASNGYTERLFECGVAISMACAGRPEETDTPSG